MSLQTRKTVENQRRAIFFLDFLTLEVVHGVISRYSSLTIRHVEECAVAFRLDPLASNKREKELKTQTFQELCTA